MFDLHECATLKGLTFRRYRPPLLLFLSLVERKLSLPLRMHEIYGSINFVEVRSKLNHHPSYPKHHFEFKKKPSLNQNNTEMVMFLKANTCGNNTSTAQQQFWKF